MAKEFEIKIEGLAEWRKALKLAEPEMAKGLGKLNREVAEFVVAEATAEAMGQGGVAAHAVKEGGMKVRARGTGVYVALDASQSPTIFGAEFGGGKYAAGHSTSAGGYTSQFKPHRGREGYFLYPTIHKRTPEIVEMFKRLVDEVTHQAFPIP